MLRFILMTHNDAITDADGLRRLLYEPLDALTSGPGFPWSAADWKLDLWPRFGMGLLRVPNMLPEVALLQKLRHLEGFRGKVIVLRDFALRNLRVVSPFAGEGASPCKPLAARRGSNVPTGAGVGIAILDKLDVNDDSRLFGPRLTRRAARDGGFDDVSNGNERTLDHHATKVASLAAGADVGFAIGAILHGYRVGLASHMINAIDKILQNPSIRVICTAVAPGDDTGATEEATNAFERVIGRARDQNVLFFAAAGDSTEAPVLPPATAPSAITVGGVQGESTISPFLPDGSKPTLLVDCGPLDSGLGGTTPCFNGTSAGTPVVAGAVATWFEKDPGLTWRRVNEILSATCRPIELPEGNVPGYGLFDPEAALAMVAPNGDSSRIVRARPPQKREQASATAAKQQARARSRKLPAR